MTDTLLAGLFLCAVALLALIPAHLDRAKSRRAAAADERAVVEARAVAHELNVNAVWR